MRALRVAALTLIFAFTPACSFYNEYAPEWAPFREAPKPAETSTTANKSATTSKPEPAKTAKVDIEKLDPNPSSDIEIIWQIPADPVDGFIVHYGYDKERLNNEVRVTSGELEKYDDPVNGTVYRYILQNIPKSKVTYVTVSAYTGPKVSSPSPVFEVGAE